MMVTAVVVVVELGYSRKRLRFTVVEFHVSVSPDHEYRRPMDFSIFRDFFVVFNVNVL